MIIEYINLMIKSIQRQNRSIMIKKDLKKVMKKNYSKITFFLKTNKKSILFKKYQNQLFNQYTQTLLFLPKTMST